MNERLKKLAMQAGLSREFSVSGLWLADDQELERFAELVREDAFGLPMIEDASQNWDKLDGAVAWHLIERHAENWADVGKMMDEYVAAKLGESVKVPEEVTQENKKTEGDKQAEAFLKDEYYDLDDDRSISPAGIHGD